MSLKEQLKLIERGKTLLNRGMKIPEIAKELHISRQRAYDLFYLTDEVAARKLTEAKKFKEKARDARDRKIWELRDKKFPMRKIGELTGTKLSTVASVLRKDKMRAGVLSKAVVEKEKERLRLQKARARELKDQGLTHEAIGKKMGKSASWVMFKLGVTKRQQKWPIEKKRETVKEYKRLLSEGKTGEEAEEMIGVSRSYLHQIRMQIEEEERIVFKGTKCQWDRIRQKERIQFTEARKKKTRELKKAKEEEKKKKIGKRNRAYGYIRVSKDEQAQRGVSLHGYQVDLIEEYAEKYDYRLLGILADEGMHGDDYNRPWLQELMSMAENDELDCIIVWMLDRLMRENYQQQKIMYEVFDPCGVDVKSTTQEMDRSTPSGKLMFNILGATNQYELDLIKERAKTAAKHIWSKGEWKSPSNVPLGLRMHKDGKHLEYDEDGMKRLKRIYKLINDNKGRVPSHPDFMNYEQIARECGVGKGKVFKLATTTLDEYLKPYQAFFGNDD